VFPAIDPGLMIQLPNGKPFKTTLPVGIAQVGCVMVPTTGAAGKALTTTVVVAAVLVHPLALVTVRL
jgi:hypothetical protein